MSTWPACLNAALRSCQDAVLHLIKVAPEGVPSVGGVRSRMKALAPLAVRIWTAARPMPDAPPAKRFRTFYYHVREPESTCHERNFVCKGRDILVFDLKRRHAYFLVLRKRER